MGLVRVMFGCWGRVSDVDWRRRDEVGSRLIEYISLAAIIMAVYHPTSGGGRLIGKESRASL